MAQAMADPSVAAESLSLDQVFVRKAVTASPGKKLHFRLTPKSKKSCLIHGIDPSVLQERDYASFAQNKHEDPEIVNMRFEMYARTREKLMQIASEERQRLVAKAESAVNESFSTTDSVSLFSKSSLATSINPEKEISTLVEQEKRRLEKIAKRQEKELLRMLAFESKVRVV